MLVRQNSSRDVIYGMDMLVLCGTVGSCCNLCLTICIAGRTGTEEVMTSPGSNLLPWSCCTKCYVFLRWCGD